MIGQALLLLTALLLGLTGCLGSLSSSSPPHFFELDHSYQPVTCPKGFGKEVRIWSFSASAPYDREEMVLFNTSHQVRFSSQYRWVTLPGEMVAEGLLQDISRDQLFTKAVSTADPFPASMELGGHIFRFAWEEEGSSGRAVLDVEVSLWQEKPKRDILFKKHYHLESEPIRSGTSDLFARTMSGLVAQLSYQLRQDLCTMRGSLSPNGG